MQRERMIPIRHRHQRGVTTLFVAMVLLFILALVILYSASATLFEQRMTTNENRGRLAEQAAEYAVNQVGEYMKANRDRLIDNTAGAAGVGGWLAPSGASTRWVSCNFSPMAANHPCMAERTLSRRQKMYFWTSDGTATGSTNVWTELVSSGKLPSASRLDSTGVGGTAQFAASNNVSALLCRIDSSLASPECRLTPASGNRIAITMVATSSLTGENAQATVKETWGSYSGFVPSSAVPLVASGFVQGLGNAQIVTSPNAGGFGVPATMWSPNNICIAETTGPCTGIGSVSTCQLGEYLQSTPEANYRTACTVNNACGCPSVNAVGSDFLSGHSVGGTLREGLDILDVDGNTGSLPDITFYPGGGLDLTTDATDDDLFEWVMGSDESSGGVDEMAEAGTKGASNTAVDMTKNTCSIPAADVPANFPTYLLTNCAAYRLVEELAAQVKTCAELNTLGANANGLYYIYDPASTSEGTVAQCSLPTQVGTPDAPVIVVLTHDARTNNTLFYGMLFVRSDNGTASLVGVGSTQFFGSVVVEGGINMAGNFTLVYDDTSISSSPNKFPKTAKFGRIPGSWLDASTGF